MFPKLVVLPYNLLKIIPEVCCDMYVYTTYSVLARWFGAPGATNHNGLTKSMNLKKIHNFY